MGAGSVTAEGGHASVTQQPAVNVTLPEDDVIAWYPGGVLLHAALVVTVVLLLVFLGLWIGLWHLYRKRKLDRTAYNRYLITWSVFQFLGIATLAVTPVPASLSAARWCPHCVVLDVQCALTTYGIWLEMALLRERFLFIVRPLHFNKYTQYDNSSITLVLGAAVSALPAFLMFALPHGIQIRYVAWTLSGALCAGWIANACFMVVISRVGCRHINWDAERNAAREKTKYAIASFYKKRTHKVQPASFRLLPSTVGNSGSNQHGLPLTGYTQDTVVRAAPVKSPTVQDPRINEDVVVIGELCPRNATIAVGAPEFAERDTASERGERLASGSDRKRVLPSQNSPETTERQRESSATGKSEIETNPEANENVTSFTDITLDQEVASRRDQVPNGFVVRKEDAAQSTEDSARFNPEGGTRERVTRFTQTDPIRICSTSGGESSSLSGNEGTSRRGRPSRERHRRALIPSGYFKQMVLPKSVLLLKTATYLILYTVKFVILSLSVANSLTRGPWGVQTLAIWAAAQWAVLALVQLIWNCYTDRDIKYSLLDFVRNHKFGRSIKIYPGC